MTTSTTTVYKARVILTAAQLQDIVANPVNLVPAPGASKAIQVLSASFNTNYNGTSYADGLYADLCYGPAANDTPCNLAEGIAFSILGDQPNFVARTPFVNAGVGNVVNQPLNFAGPNNFTGNGGNVVVNVIYTVVSLT